MKAVCWGLLLLEAAALLSMAYGGSGTPVPALPLWLVAIGAWAIGAAQSGGARLRYVWLAGVALRLSVFSAAPVLSEDIYRYLWDGFVQTQGINPYAFAPSAPELDGVRTEWFTLINHPEVPTIYPGGAQLVFWFLALVGGGLPVLKLIWIAADLGVAWCVQRLAGPDIRPLALYLWSPLAIVEVAWNGHLDPLGMFPMLLAVVVAGSARSGTQPRQGLRAGALLGVGASIKLGPIAVLPALMRRHGIAGAATAFAVVGLAYLPYAMWSSGEAALLFAGLREYADRWEFNPGVYALLRLIPGHPDLAKWIGATAMAAVIFHSWRRRWELDRALIWTLGVALILSPTVHPWYVLWVLPLACIRMNHGLLLFSGRSFFPTRVETRI